MKNYVISLNNAKERREHITQEFGKQNIDFAFFDAIMPNQVHELAKKFTVEIQHSNLTLGELGCFFSHIMLWQKMFDDNLDYIAIFEDDVHLGKNAHLFLQDDTWLKDEAIDFIKIEMFDKIKNMSIQSTKTLDNRKIRTLLDMHLGTAGYILSNKMAKKLLAYIKSQSLVVPIDNLIFGNYLFCDDNLDKIYQLCPALCIQHDRLYTKDDCHQGLKSQIQETRQKRKNTINKEKNIFKKILRELIRPFKQIIFKIKTKSKVNLVDFR